MVKQLPNILISGTPGTGKTTLAARLIQELADEKYRHVNIGDFAKESGCLGQYDPLYDCHELDEDAVLDKMEEFIELGGVIVDHHVTDFFPERYFDIVFVLRTNNTELHDRLKARNYSGKKLEDNIQCEIFQTVLDEAKESYEEEIVHELMSDSKTDIEQNVIRIKSWIQHWKEDNNIK